MFCLTDVTRKVIAKAQGQVVVPYGFALSASGLEEKEAYAKFGGKTEVVG